MYNKSFDLSLLIIKIAAIRFQGHKVYTICNSTLIVLILSF